MAVGKAAVEEFHFPALSSNRIRALLGLRRHHVNAWDVEHLIRTLMSNKAHSRLSTAARCKASIQSWIEDPQAIGNDPMRLTCSLQWR